MADLNCFRQYVCGYTGSEAERQEYRRALSLSDAEIASILEGCAGGSAYLASGNSAGDRVAMLTEQQQELAQTTMPRCPTWARTIVSCRQTNRRINAYGYAGALAGILAGGLLGRRWGHMVAGAAIVGFVGYVGARFWEWPKGGSW